MTTFYKRLPAWCPPALMGLFVLMVVGVVLRAWGLDFGLPNDSRPDEANVIQAILYHLLTPVVEQGDWRLHPQYFRYPSAYLYLMMPLYFILYWWGVIQGTYANWSQFLLAYMNDGTPFHMVMRWFTVVCGALLIPMAYQLAKSLSQHKWVPWLAAVLMTVCYLMVRTGHFGGVDMPMTLVGTVALWATLRWQQSQQAHWLNTAIVAIGVATGIKYPAAVYLVPLWVAIFLKHCQDDYIAWRSVLLKVVQVTGLTFLVFLVTSPWTVLDINFFLHDFTYEATHYFGFAMPGVSSGWQYYLAPVLWHGVGGWVLLFALLGMIQGLRAPSSQRKQNYNHHHWVLLSFVIAFYILLGTNQRVMARYALPLVPVILVYAAFAVGCLSQVIKDWLTLSHPTTKALPFALLSLLLLIPTGLQSVYFNGVIAKTDTRNLARHWLLSNVPPSAIAVGPRLGQIKLPNQYGQLTVETGPGNPGRPQTVDISDIDPRTKNINTYANWSALQQLGIRYVVLYGAMPLFSNPPWTHQLYQSQAKLVYEAIPFYNGVNPNNDLGQFDILDAFYLPYDTLKAVERPGPAVYIYELPAPSGSTS